MTEKTFRDELAMSFDPKGYTFDRLEDLFAFAGHDFSMEQEALKRASVTVTAKLRYMYADAMLEARGPKVEKELTVKPDAEGWMSYDGQGMPCDKNQEVNIRLRDGTEDTYRVRAELWDWDRIDSEEDIVAWRLAK